MIVGEATVTVAASPSDVWDFVLDLDRYRQADHKIGRISAVQRDGDHGTMRFNGRIRGMPGPAGTYPFELSPTHLTVTGPVDGAARWFLDFEGRFDCEESPDGTIVTHREGFEFKPMWRWVAEPLLRSWLEADVRDEMRRFKELIERS